MTDRTPHGEHHRDLPAWLSPARKEKPLDLEALFAGPLTDANQAFERAYIIRVLERANGCMAEAARLAGRHRSTFYDLVASHGIDHNAFRQREAA